MASIVQLRQRSDVEIEKMLENAREEMFNLRFQNASARLSDVSRLRAVGREIAQFETVLHMRQLAIARAKEQPKVAETLKGKEWSAKAHFSYEDSAWEVTFLDEKDSEITTVMVDLNKKQPKGRRARQAAKR